MREELSRAELRVLRAYLLEGTREGAAAQLFLSSHTVRNHLASIYAKLKAHNVIEAARIMGWICIPDMPDIDK